MKYILLIYVVFLYLNISCSNDKKVDNDSNKKIQGLIEKIGQNEIITQGLNEKLRQNEIIIQELNEKLRQNETKTQEHNEKIGRDGIKRFGTTFFANKDPIYIYDMYINDFEILANNVHLNHSQFETYNVWKKEINSPILDTEFKLRYRTIIRDASEMEPNFDGKYRIITFGVGTGTTAYFILDLNTGIVYECNSYSYFGMDYNVNSSLLIINPVAEIIDYWGNSYNIIPGWAQVEYLTIMNGKLRTLLLINPVRNSEEKVFQE